MADVDVTASEDVAVSVSSGLTLGLARPGKHRVVLAFLIPHGTWGHPCDLPGLSRAASCCRWTKCRRRGSGRHHEIWRLQVFPWLSQGTPVSWATPVCPTILHCPTILTQAPTEFSLEFPFPRAPLAFPCLPVQPSLALTLPFSPACLGHRGKGLAQEKPVCSSPCLGE